MNDVIVPGREKIAAICSAIISDMSPVVSLVLAIFIVLSIALEDDFCEWIIRLCMK